MARIFNRIKTTLSLAVLGGLVACSPTVLQGAGGPEAEGIVVSGVGKASGPPDVARVTVGVEVRAKASEAAAASNAERMRELTLALKKLGIAEADLKTQNFSVYFEQDFRPLPPVAEPLPEPSPKGAKAGGGSPGSVGAAATASPAQLEPPGFYRATNTLEVTVRDLTKLGEILGTATAHGANAVHGVSFELSNPKALESEAREKAVADAKARAEQLARLSGVTLGPVLFVNESVAYPGPMHGPMFMAKGAAEGAQSAPVESGQLEIVSQVSLRYGIKKSGE